MPGKQRLVVCVVQVSDTQPTAGIEALITTTAGISLVFDPLIRPQQVVADVAQGVSQGVTQAATTLATGRR